MRQVRAAVDLPLLRKDFILDPYQVLQARVAGADAVLLIAECLDDALLRRLHDDIVALGMTPLVELYEPENLPRVLAAGARLVGVNNRDLRTFHADLAHTLRLRAEFRRDRLVVGESGIRTRADVLRLQAAGVHAMLVGETLVTRPDIGAAVDELLGARERMKDEGSRMTGQARARVLRPLSFLLHPLHQPGQLPARRRKRIGVQLARTQPTQLGGFGFSVSADGRKALGLVTLQRDAEPRHSVLERLQVPHGMDPNAGQPADAGADRGDNGAKGDSPIFVRPCLHGARNWDSPCRVECESGEIPQSGPTSAVGPPHEEHAAAAPDHHGRFPHRLGRRLRPRRRDPRLQSGRERPAERRSPGSPGIAACAAGTPSLPSSISAWLNRPALRGGTTASAMAQPSFCPAAEAVSPDQASRRLNSRLVLASRIGCGWSKAMERMAPAV